MAEQSRLKGGEFQLIREDLIGGTFARAKISTFELSLVDIQASIPVIRIFESEYAYLSVV